MVSHSSVRLFNGTALGTGIAHVTDGAFSPNTNTIIGHAFVRPHAVEFNPESQRSIRIPAMDRLLFLSMDALHVGRSLGRISSVHGQPSSLVENCVTRTTSHLHILFIVPRLKVPPLP